MTTIETLEWMIKEYDKRGGGYSQKEALKEAISSLKGHPDCEPTCQELSVANTQIENLKQEVKVQKKEVKRLNTTLKVMCVNLAEQSRLSEETVLEAVKDKLYMIPCKTTLKGEALFLNMGAIEGLAKAIVALMDKGESNGR